MSSCQRYRINQPDVAFESVDGEVVMISFSSGRYYSLRGVAAQVLEAIHAGWGAPQLTTALAATYAPAAERIEADVRSFVTLLLGEKLIVPHESDRGPAPGPLPGPAPAETYAPPQLEKYDDMQDLFLLDPIHEVDEQGWPQRKAS